MAQNSTHRRFTTRTEARSGDTGELRSTWTDDAQVRIVARCRRNQRQPLSIRNRLTNSGGSPLLWRQELARQAGGNRAAGWPVWRCICPDLTAYGVSGRGGWRSRLVAALQLAGWYERLAYYIDDSRDGCDVALDVSISRRWDFSSRCSLAGPVPRLRPLVVASVDVADFAATLRWPSPAVGAGR
jgi:hypothetical protein